MAIDFHKFHQVISFGCGVIIQTIYISISSIPPVAFLCFSDHLLQLGLLLHFLCVQFLAFRRSNPENQPRRRGRLGSLCRMQEGPALPAVGSASISRMGDYENMASSFLRDWLQILLVSLEDYIQIITLLQGSGQSIHYLNETRKMSAVIEIEAYLLLKYCRIGTRAKISNCNFCSFCPYCQIILKGSNKPDERVNTTAKQERNKKNTSNTMKERRVKLSRFTTWRQQDSNDGEEYQFPIKNFLCQM